MNSQRSECGRHVVLQQISRHQARGIPAGTTWPQAVAHLAHQLLMWKGNSLSGVWALRLSVSGRCCWQRTCFHACSSCVHTAAVVGWDLPYAWPLSDLLGQGRWCRMALAAVLLLLAGLRKAFVAHVLPHEFAAPPLLLSAGLVHTLWASKPCGATPECCAYSHG